MLPTEFNNFLAKSENIMLFPAYMKKINTATFNIDTSIINDHLFIYGKTKPCINESSIYCYKNVKKSINISKLVNTYNLKKDIDYIIDNGKYILSPRAYYAVIFSFGDIDLIDQFHKVFIYERMYDVYLRMKKQ